jgi:hypothetical protein
MNWDSSVESPHLGNLLLLSDGEDNADMERRKARRTKMVLPVKITASGVFHLAHTSDLTCLGARLGGLHTELKQGEIVSVQRGPKKANFKVVWVQHLGANEVHVGLQAVAKQGNFWGVDLPQPEHDSKSDADPVMAPAPEKP